MEYEETRWEGHVLEEVASCCFLLLLMFDVGFVWFALFYLLIPDFVFLLFVPFLPDNLGLTICMMGLFVSFLSPPPFFFNYLYVL